jgi:hypothetical protein
MKITSDLTNLTTAILILTVQMFFESTLFMTDLRISLTYSSVINFYFILCQISILYVISLNPGKRKKRPDAG